MKTFLFSTLLFSSSVFAQYDKYYSDDGGSSNPLGLIIAVIAVVLTLIYGSKEAKLGLLKFFVFLAGAIGYMYLLNTIGKSLQEAFAPTKHGIGAIYLITFIVGWFGPIWWYSKKGGKS
jgi:hypothetical protein